VVCIEIFEGSISYAEDNLPKFYPPSAHHNYGYSFVLAWISFVLFLLAGIVILFYSRKEKNADKDQPVILGRL